MAEYRRLLGLEAFLGHCFPSELRLVSSRAQPGLPRVSRRTHASLTSLPTEALLPRRAGTTPRVSRLDEELGHHQAGPREPGRVRLPSPSDALESLSLAKLES